jgi:hypothetical protein
VGAVVNNRVLFRKKREYAKSIADMHDAEVFGIGCNDKWNCLMKDYVIIDVLETYKKKCYNPCFDFTVTNLGEGLYTVAVDCFGFDLVVGDEITFVSESLELLDTDIYTIDFLFSFSQFEEGIQEFLLENGYSENTVVLFLKDSDGADKVVNEGDVIGSFSLVTPKEIVNDDRELLQEDINCLTGKIC